jgi:hypothetical protein
VNKLYCKPIYSLGQLIRTHAGRIARSPDFNSHQKRMLMALGACRTAALGAHKVACTECDARQIPQTKVSTGLFRRLFAKPWMPYAEQPFRKARQVVNYIGRYSHSIAIANHRIKKVAGSMVTFSYKNYRKKGKKEHMQLGQWEFIRRFAMHIIPHRFVRIPPAL